MDSWTNILPIVNSIDKIFLKNNEMAKILHILNEMVNFHLLIMFEHIFHFLDQIVSFFSPLKHLDQGFRMKSNTN